MKKESHRTFVQAALLRVLWHLFALVLAFFSDVPLQTLTERHIAGDRWCRASGFLVLGDSGFLITASEYGAASKPRIGLYRLRADGSFLWKQTISSSGPLYPLRVISGIGGEVFLLANITRKNPAAYSFVVYKLNPAGGIEWQHPVEEPGEHLFAEQCEFSGKVLFIAAKAVSRATGRPKAYIMSLDPATGDRFTAAFPAENLVNLSGILPLDRNLYVAGNTRDTLNGSLQWFILQIDRELRLLGEYRHRDTASIRNFGLVTIKPGEFLSACMQAAPGSDTGAFVFFMRRESDSAWARDTFPANGISPSRIHLPGRRGMLVAGDMRTPGNSKYNTVILHFSAKRRFLQQVFLPSPNTELVEAVESIDGKFFWLLSTLRSKRNDGASVILRKIELP